MATVLRIKEQDEVLQMCQTEPLKKKMIKLFMKQREGFYLMRREKNKGKFGVESQEKHCVSLIVISCLQVITFRIIF